LSEGAKFCKACGQSVAKPEIKKEAAAPVSSCKACQAVLPEGARFCKQCGARVGQTPEISRPSATKTIVILAGIALLILIAASIGLYFFTHREVPDETPVTESPVTTTTAPAETQATEPEPPTAEEPSPAPAKPPVAPAPKTDDELEDEEDEAFEWEDTPETVPPSSRPRPSDRRAPSRPPSAEPMPRPEIAPQRSCAGLSGFPAFLCRTEGPTRFWRCVPDGKNWDNDIPGCRRESSRNHNAPY
jgi:hypothetical protein